MTRFDFIVIGAGPGGYAAAIKAAQLGMRVAVVEKDQLGGTCLNRGCIPTKAILQATNLYRKAQSFATLGLSIGSLAYDLPAIYQRKDNIVGQLRQGIQELLSANKIELIAGEAQISSAHSVQVQGEQGLLSYEAENILIATGSKPVSLHIPGINLPGVMDSDEFLAQPHDCHSLSIIGAGVIGMEIATMMNNLGIEVTLIELLDRVLPTMDREISQNLSMIMKKRGVNIHTYSRLTEISAVDGQLLCSFTEKTEPRQVCTDLVLLAMGRRGCTENLFTPQLNIKLNAKTAQIAVDDKHRTSIENIYAIGDVAENSIQLAHMASAAGINVACLLAGKEKELDESTVTSCIFTEPQIASIGITEAEAKQQSIVVKTGKYLTAASGRSLIEEAERGFIKIVAEQASHKIIGAQLMCEHAADIASELALAISQELRAEDIGSLIHAHPTFSEGIGEAADAIFGSAIHISPKRK